MMVVATGRCAEQSVIAFNMDHRTVGGRNAGTVLEGRIGLLWRTERKGVCLKRRIKNGEA